MAFVVVMDLNKSPPEQRKVAVADKWPLWRVGCL